MANRFELEGWVARSALSLRARPEVLASAINPNLDRVMPRLPISDTEPPDWCLRNAERFHLIARSQQDERRALIETAYASLGRPPSLVLSICGAKYLPLLRLWLQSCDRSDIDVRGRTIIMALDGETARVCGDLGVEAVPVDPAGRFEIVEASRFADDRFGEVMLHKNTVVLDALTVVPRLLFQDVDLLWFRDPFRDLESRAENADVLFMYDGPNHWHRPLHLNTGFFFAVANEATAALFETIARNAVHVLASGSQQYPANRIIGHFAVHNVLRVGVLAQERYLNGHLFNLETGVSPAAGDWRRDGFVLHYSWTADIDQKLAKLEQFDLV